MKCGCIDWKNNADLLDQIRVPQKRWDTHKAFKYCPWCGSNLMKE